MPSIAKKLVTLRPEFKVTAPPQKVKDYLVKFIDRVEEGLKDGKSPGVLHYDFLWNEDNTKFQCREMYESSKALSDHITYTGDLFGPMFEMGVELVSCEVFCPKEATSDETFMGHMKEFNAKVFIKD